MPVSSLAEDKPKILFHAAMMAIQNFGFFNMYFDIWGDTPFTDVCMSTRAATGFMALSCFCVAFLCVGMGFGGYIDDKRTFQGYWFAHLAGGLCYTACTVMVPLARWSDDGKLCADLNQSNGERLEIVYYLHAALYLVYVGSMLAITWFSFVKGTYFNKGVSESQKSTF